MRFHSRIEFNDPFLEEQMCDRSGRGPVYLHDLSAIIDSEGGSKRAVTSPLPLVTRDFNFHLLQAYH